MVDEEREHEGVRVHDRRRIDPETYEVREPAEPAPSPTEAEVADDDAKVAELTDDLRRVHAEYANYRKRIDRDREVNHQIAIGVVFAELLPILDDVERAREHDELTGAFKTFGEKLEATLNKLGLEKFGAAQDPFDPNLHEALSSIEAEGVAEPTVIAVFQQGYRQGDRILRPARVSVAGT